MHYAPKIARRMTEDGIVVVPLPLTDRHHDHRISAVPMRGVVGAPFEFSRTATSAPQYREVLEFVRQFQHVNNSGPTRPLLITAWRIVHAMGVIGVRRFCVSIGLISIFQDGIFSWSKPKRDKGSGGP
jgi:hypothetical protein